MITEAGIDVYQIPSNQYKFAIIDNEVVWYGGVDLLGGNRDEVSVVRIISSELANELQGVIEERLIDKERWDD